MPKPWKPYEYIHRGRKRSHLLGKKSVRESQYRKARIHKRLMPIRTPKNPVSVVFVCMDGGSSGLDAKIFNRKMALQKIQPFVTARFQRIYNDNPRGLKTPDELKQALSDADIIVPSSEPALILSRSIQTAMRKDAILIRTVSPMNPYFGHLLKLIKHHFRFETPLTLPKKQGSSKPLKRG